LGKRENEATASQLSVLSADIQTDFVESVVIDYWLRALSQSLEFGCGSAADLKFVGELLF
jgi:hypothetical protein